MTKVKPYLGKHCLISIYYSLVYSHLIYGCSLWGNNYDSPLSQLIRLQNKAVRIMNDTPLRDPITPYYANSGLLKFRDIVNLYMLQLNFTFRSNFFNLGYNFFNLHYRLNFF